MILDVQNLHLSINKKPLVRGVSFTIQRGETVALVGASGSGKSLTAQSILLPVATVDQGAILFQGKNLLTLSPQALRAVRGKQIGMIFQDPVSSLNPTMRIGEQLVEATCCRQKAYSLLKRVGIAEPEVRAKQYPFELSGGMCQRVMIAMAIASDPLLLVADEPTTALDLTIQAGILALLKSLQEERGLALLFITHDLKIVAGISDRVLVMSQGKIVESGTTDQIFYSPQHPYTKELFALQHFPEKHSAATKEPLVTFQGVGKRYGKLTALSPMTLEIFKGETVALVGESGSGKSTLGKIAAGLMEPSDGVVHYDGLPIKGLQRRIQILFQNPYGSLNPKMRVVDIVEEPFAIHRDLPKKPPEELLEMVGLSSEHLRSFPYQLSGGQRQRVALARVLAVDPEFLVLDEPLSALDANAQHQILTLLQELKKERGLTFLFITHDLHAVKAMADRMAVLYLGQLLEVTDGEPVHPYSKALLSAVCYPDPRSERKRQRLLLTGEMPSPFEPPRGCPFRSRCPKAEAICQTPPPLVQVGENSWARCHF